MRKVLVLSHTHWDREWYESFESFRYRLVKVVDELIELLEGEGGYECFNFDGQIVALEDYLEIRPEKRETLKGLVAQGKIGIGPWYVQLDEFLADGEAIVRNLLVGRNLESEFGRLQRLVYLPDTFGHNSQIPQIAGEFGMRTALVWRGVSGDDLPWEFIWKGADGSRLLTCRLPERLGYCNLAFTPEGGPVDVSFFLSSIDDFVANSQMDLVVLMDGCDHKRVNPAIIDFIGIAKRDSDLECGQALLDDLSRELEERALSLKSPLRVLEGELRQVNTSSRGYFNFILPNVLSSRYNNKRENAMALNLIENYAEPLSTMAWLAGREYPASFLARSWKLILQNLAHDSIGGCSVDRVHLDVSSRFAHSIEISANIVKDSLAALCEAGNGGDESSFVIYNPSQFEVHGAFKIEIDLPESVMADSSKLPIVLDSSGNEVPFEIIGLDKHLKALNYYDESAPLKSVNSLEGIIESSIKGLSFEKYSLVLSERPLNYSCRSAGAARSIENEYLIVDVMEDSTLKITDKESGRIVYTNLFEDSGDNGDGYVYSEPLFNKVVSSYGAVKKLDVVHNGRLASSLLLEYILSVPVGLERDGSSRSEIERELKINCIVSLVKGSRIVDFRVEVENHCKNHRLQVKFWSSRPGSYFYYKTPFDVVQREKEETFVWKEIPNWIENPPPFYPNNSLFGEAEELDGFYGFAVSPKGIYEFENTKDGLKLTLFRATGHIGSPYTLYSMKRNAGPVIETPGAQMIGEMTFEYALFFTDSLDSALERSSLYLKTPISMTQMRRVPKAPFEIGSKTCEITAIKKAENRESVIVRLSNLSNRKDRISVKFDESLFSKVFLCSSSEERLEEIQVVGGAFSVVCEPKKLLTLEMHK